MKPKRLWSPVFTIPLTLAAIVLSIGSTASAAPQYKVLHAFGAGNDGATVWGGLVRDSKGHLYGTTAGGGAYTYGSVFELTPDSGGKWTEQVLHSFQNNGSDGTEPSSTLILDGVGNLYGTTPDGANRHCTYGCGVVFELTPHPSGWSEAVLYRFPLPRGGCCPYAGVIRDAAGNLYGTAGYPFELSPGSHGWEEKVLSRFPGTDNGSEPFAGLVMDPSGSLYGTTEHGGGSPNCGGGCGTVFQVTPEPDGKWKEHVLHAFGNGDSMAFPGVGALALDSAGRLYGTASGGTYAQGAVYRLSRGAGGGWKIAILHSFSGGAGGANPGAGVVMDKTGNLYGTTIDGGTGCDCGVVYKLAPQANGKWKYTVLHTFIGSDGAQPDANLILDDKGNLYGTTAVGGTAGAGVAFELTP